MNIRVCFAGALLATMAAACVPTEKVAFNAGPQQQSVVRDGRNAVISKKKSSTVIVTSASREIASGSRPVFVVGIQNNGKIPSDFRVTSVSAVQIQDGAPSKSMAVVTYDQLVSEERTRQVVSAILVGAAIAGNAYAAQNASYTNSGRYSPIAGAINGARADAQNAALIGETVAGGQLNLAALEQNVIKDNTVMPAEWVGGQLHIEPPAGGVGAAKAYVITVPVGNDIHEITVTQGKAV
ncbi:hypothetical protein [Methylobacterium sp. Leaf118]|uniref:hypothetical protein n=1 Tax=Methylobacterium sp. Leaf118 TaxID=2876562 RepID=UPI001E40F4B6|nr:hypothetical protein [Methylobacterium sp. Leaf118]